MSVWVQVVQHLQPGGIETMALDLQRLDEQGELGLIVSLEGSRATALERWPRLRPFADRLVFLNKAPGWRLATLFELVKLFRRWNVAAVHTHHIGPLLYGGLAARLAGVKVVIHTEHDAWHLRQHRRRLLQNIVIRCVRPLMVADACLVADELKSHLGLSGQNVHIIKNGIDMHQFNPGDQQQARQRLGLPPSAKLIGCAGRLEPEKGQRVLLDALRFLDQNVHLALAGDGSQYPALVTLAEQANLTDRVHFLGPVEQMLSFYQALDLYCSPSFFEGLSLVILEAQACGIAVVATDVGASSEAICPTTGSLVEPGSAFALAQALERKLQSRTHGNPRQYVRQVGDLRATARHYAALRRRYS